ncbi:hypothetical protein [Streptomyces misionensis]|uniref:hypothetical protein n=1 Tax=Streptomyces misionensis TaxID=67331 RepID=UPI0036AEAF1E
MTERAGSQHPDADVRSFTFDTHADPCSSPLPGIPTGLPTDARGTVKVSHYSADRKVTYTAEGHVDCLVTGPGTATLTAVITKVGPGGRTLDGQATRVQRLRRRRRQGPLPRPVGFSWEMVNLLPGGTGAPSEAEVGTCMAPAPYAPVVKGGYTVRHADLPPAPQR